MDYVITAVCIVLTAVMTAVLGSALGEHVANKSITQACAKYNLVVINDNVVQCRLLVKEGIPQVGE